MDVSEQKESEEARTHLSGLLIGAQEQERTRIARELHDHINQRLALLAIDLQQFEQSANGLPEDKKAELEQLWELTNDISRDVQALSHQLHSSQLQHLGLVAAVRGLCQEFSRSGSIEAEFASLGVPLKLDENISLALFRVTQEALRNVSKYSHARTVNVELVCERSEVSLIIRDDGIGFVPEDVNGNGLGLISMRERMRLVGGDLSVVSAPGQGTRIGAHLRLVSAPDVAEQPATAAKVDRRKRVRA